MMYVRKGLGRVILPVFFRSRRNLTFSNQGGSQARGGIDSRGPRYRFTRAALSTRRAQKQIPITIRSAKQKGKFMKIATLHVAGAFAERLLIILVFSLLPVVAHADLQYHQIKSFGFPDQMGVSPRAPLIEGTDGLLYGTSYGGAPGDSGTVFELNKDGSGYRVLHRFGSIDKDGFFPQAALVKPRPCQYSRIGRVFPTGGSGKRQRRGAL